MKYPNLFKSRYGTLQGRDWVNTLEPDDRKAFIELGLSETDYGRKGGNALLEKYGHEHLVNIGRIGGIMKAIRNEWNRAVARETFLQGGNDL